MEKVAPNSKFFGHSTEIIWQSKIKGPLSQPVIIDLNKKLNPKQKTIQAFNIDA